MKPIHTDFLSQAGTLREDEYRDQATGLIHCSKCGTPRQKRFSLLGKLYEPRTMCQCQQAQNQRKTQELRRREFLDQVAKNRSIALPSPELRQHTFENDRGYNPSQMETAKKYVQNWEEFRKKSIGLLFWGGVGTGKSFLAGCIANALLDQGVKVTTTNFTRLLNQLTDLYAGERNDFIDSFNRYPLLIIDDLGVERNSDFAREQVFHIIDSRYRSGLPTIVTTNLTLKEMKKPPDLARSRIYDRVLERCIPVLVNGQNIRKLLAAENMAAAQNMMQGE